MHCSSFLHGDVYAYGLPASSLSNKTIEDILMRWELLKYRKEEPDRFKVTHLLSHRPPEDLEFPVSR